MARKYADPSRRWQAGIASDYIAHLPPLLAVETKPVVLICRVSTTDQEDNGNLGDAVADALRVLRGASVEPMRVFASPERSSICCDRPTLWRAIAYAAEHTAILVAPSRDRFIRSHNLREDERPTIREYLELCSMAGGVTLATLLHPDAAARSEQTKRGQEAKGRKGGGDRKPGRLKRRRIDLLPKVLELARQGMSCRGIEHETGVKWRTVADWIRRET